MRSSTANRTHRVYVYCMVWYWTVQCICMYNVMYMYTAWYGIGTVHYTLVL